MIYQKVSFEEAVNLFKQHCDVILKDKHLMIFDYYLSVTNILNMVEQCQTNVYKSIVYKWAADIGLHIE